ncbi:MAG: universal stress protein [Cyclobacteriaceae bacterium]|nr:universal stress protein [Cyclobacteriaceae bacterium]
MSKVLCPVDFSEASLNAVEYAANIAAKMKYSLHLVNVFTEDEFNKVVNSVRLNKSFKEAFGEAKVKLDAICKEVNNNYKSQGLVNCENEVSLGELEDVLLDQSKESEVQVIVMGTTGVGKSTWIGSNTSHMVLKCTKPLFCIPIKASYTGFEKIVYATDIDESDKIIIQDVVSFALTFNSRIYALHLYSKLDKLEEMEINVFFDELKSFIPYKKISFESIKYDGELSHSLIKYMQDKGCSLLAIYSKNRGALESLFHKSLAKELSVISNQPLMILK